MPRPLKAKGRQHHDDRQQLPGAAVCSEAFERRSHSTTFGMQLAWQAAVRARPAAPLRMTHASAAKMSCKYDEALRLLEKSNFLPEGDITAAKTAFHCQRSKCAKRGASYKFFTIAADGRATLSPAVHEQPCQGSITLKANQPDADRHDGD